MNFSEEYTIPDPDQGEYYFRIPRAFWTEGLVGELSGPGLAMYLVALAHCGWTDPEFWISSAHFRDQFGLSETTRKKGLADLVDHGVLTVSLASREMASGRRFERNVYCFQAPYWSGTSTAVEASPPTGDLHSNILERRHHRRQRKQQPPMDD